MPQGIKGTGLQRDQVETALHTHGSLRAAARALDVPAGTMLRRASELGVRSDNPGGSKPDVSDEAVRLALQSSTTRVQAALSLNLARSSLYSRLKTWKKRAGHVA